MTRLCAAILAAFLCACAATATPKQIAQEAPVQTCPGPDIASLSQAMKEHGLVKAADYKGVEATAFHEFLTKHVVDQAPETEFDEIIVWQREKIGIIVWFNHGCAIAHAAGPYQLVEPFIGQAI